MTEIKNYSEYRDCLRGLKQQIRSGQGKAVTNFKLTLPAVQSDLANEIMKDPYHFDFLRLSEKAKESDLEKALIQHISHFLPELGIGFAYMGRRGQANHRCVALQKQGQLRS